MTMTIETVPESISFERVQELVRALGMETRDLLSLRIDRDAITAEVYARNAEGKHFLVGRGDDAEVAVHQVVIPVTIAGRTADGDVIPA